MLLNSIHSAKDIKKIPKGAYTRLASEIREFLVKKLSVSGGHLASNLGVVELTMALFLSFRLPKDKIIWDVGHQSYTHKILSGRKDAFDELRQYKGLSGFPKTQESPCDAFNTGHSSTSISAGLGLVRAAQIAGREEYVVSVIGDGALTGGMAYEALNNASQIKRNFIMVLNDNTMSISPNVGGISRYLSTIRTGSSYHRLKKNVLEFLERIPLLGDPLIDSIKQAKEGIKQMLIPGMFFENMGITYLGPVDGHNIKQLCRVFKEAKKLNQAVLIHVLTQKGKGYGPAEENPEAFHGVGAFDIVSGASKKIKEHPDYSDVFSDSLCELARQDGRITAITAAMPEGTGLKAFSQQFPERFFDVGIAEAHGVTFAAGLAAGGLHPVVAVYSSFLQRAFDQIVHDVCIQNLPVLFAVDRAGLVGADGDTHQGIFDISFLGCIPNMTIMAPKNAAELRAMLSFGLELGQPAAIRYPRGKAYESLGQFRSPIVYGKGEMLFEESEIAILALGSMVSTGEHIREKLKKKGHSCSLANARFAKPVDFEMVDRLCASHQYLLLLEENVKRGGFGETVASYIEKKGYDVKVTAVHIPDAYVEHGDVSLLRKALKIDSDSVMERLREEFGL